MIQTILFTIWAILIYNIWAWIIRKISKHHTDRNIRFYTISVGILSCISVFFVPKIIALLWINSEKFAETMNITTIIFYVSYIVLSWFIWYLIYSFKTINKSTVVRFFIFFLLFIVISLWWLLLNIPKFIIYFGLVAFGEEYIKYIFGYSLFDKIKIHFTDILLFTLISAFGFAFIENIFYGFYSIPGDVIDTLNKVSIFAKTLVQRWIVNVAVHWFFTVIIAWIAITSPDDKYKLWKIILWIIVWVGSHWIYNSTVNRWIMITLPFFVLWWYILITYIIYKSDTIFSSLDKEISQKNTQTN